MKKSLAVLLLLLVAGCGKNDQTSESSPQKPPPPTLADSFKGKRIHFQIPDQKEEPWLQLGDNNQVAVNGGRLMSYAINETKLIVDSGGKLIEMRFSKPDLAVGDQIIIFEHEDGNLQALLDSTDDSGDKVTGSITKIEAAQEIDDQGPEDTGEPERAPKPDIDPASIEPSTQQPTASQIIFPVAGTITYDGKPLTGARIRLEAAGRRASRVYACDTKPNGTFEIVAVYSTGVKSGAPIGKYKVLVGKWEKDETDSDELGFEEALELELIEEESEVAPAPKSLILEKFSNASLTPLKLEVKEGKNSFRIDLKSDGTGTVKAL